MRLEETDGGFGIHIADDGSGLPDDRVEEAFDRFVTLDGQGGSGLGLPTARAIVRTHGGELTWRRDRFVLRLPDAGPPRPQRPLTDAGASP